MKNDPFPYFDFLGQRQLGELYGVSAQRIGIWLMEAGLRRGKGRPTEQAVEEGLVEAVTEGDLTFYSWHKEKVIKIFERLGHHRPLPPTAMPDQPVGRLNGPFTARASSTDGGDGFEVVNGDGTTGVWVRGKDNAEMVARLLNIAHKCGKI